MPPSSRVCRGGTLFRSRIVSLSRTSSYSSSSCAGCQPHRNARSLRPYFSSGSASLIFSPQQCFGRSWLTLSHQSKPSGFSDLLLSADQLAELLAVWSRVRSPESLAPDSSCSLQRSCWRLLRNVCADFPAILRRMTSEVSNQSAANSGKARRTLFDLPIYSL